MIARRLVLIPAIALAASVASEAAAQQGRKNAAPGGKTVGISAFLKQYCVRCHGARKPKGDISLHQLGDGPIQNGQAAIWRKVFDQIQSAEMPPEDAKQPSLQQRSAALTWIAQSLQQAGAPVDAGKWLHPSHGNWLDHDALFSGKPTAATATRGRLWRLTGTAYEEFIQSLNAKYRLGFKTYGHSRVRAPWQLASQSGLRDYATLHRIGEPEIEHHLRNAKRVALAIISRLPKTRSKELLPLKDLLTAENKPSAEQVQAATVAAFAGILGRQPTKAEQQRYAGFLQGNLKTLGTSKALEQLLIAILFHPEVMYRIELPEAGAKREMIPPRHLARSIAYALTDREPDDQLRRAAAAGQLATREQVRVEVLRILNDRSIAKPRLLRFFQEYFGYPSAIDVFKDSTTRKAAGFRGKNDWHPNFFVSDTDRLIEWVIAADKNVLYELLTTPKTFTLTGDTKQAKGRKKNPTRPFSLFAKTTLGIYEIEMTPAEWSDERPFEMPKQHRMGILTHPSWLIAHSTNFDNNAIHRGKWIRERLLGGRIPEIPVTVDATLPEDPKKTLRERMHVTTKAYCWKCHQRMDPLGLPFEQFDHFGRFRKSELNKPVQTTGNITRSGDPRLDGPVKDPFELLQKLAKSKRVEQVFVRYAFRYFVGRNETTADGPTLVAAHTAYVKSGGSMKALIASLLTSDAFLYRTVAASETTADRKTTRKQP